MARFRAFLLDALLIAAYPCGAFAQTDVTIAPFISTSRSNSAGTTGGLALTVSGAPGFALRLNGRTAMHSTSDAGVGSSIRPWAADVDAVIAASGHPFGSSRRTVATFAFIGVGANVIDSAATGAVTRDWSYGVGTSVPLGSLADLFVDSRWRIAGFVLPTASSRPRRTKEIRFGLTLHVSGRD